MSTTKQTQPTLADAIRAAMLKLDESGGDWVQVTLSRAQVESALPQAEAADALAEAAEAAVNQFSPAMDLPADTALRAALRRYVAERAQSS